MISVLLRGTSDTNTQRRRDHRAGVEIRGMQSQAQGCLGAPWHLERQEGPSPGASGGGEALPCLDLRQLGSRMGRKQISVV